MGGGGRRFIRWQTSLRRTSTIKRTCTAHPSPLPRHAHFSPPPPRIPVYLPLPSPAHALYTMTNYTLSCTCLDAGWTGSFFSLSLSFPFFLLSCHRRFLCFLNPRLIFILDCTLSTPQQLSIYRPVRPPIDSTVCLSAKPAFSRFLSKHSRKSNRKKTQRNNGGELSNHAESSLLLLITGAMEARARKPRPKSHDRD